MGSETHQDNINAQLAGMFAANTNGAATGGGFAFTEPDMRTIITNWLDLAENYRKSMANANLMSRIEPPAEDFASRAHSVAANQSGESYRRYLEHNRAHCLHQAQLFQSALDDYLGVEHTNAADINNTGPQGPVPGV
jgi:hypothetical protein